MSITHVSVYNKLKKELIIEYSLVADNLDYFRKQILRSKLPNGLKVYKDPQFYIVVKTFNELILISITNPEYPVEKTTILLDEIMIEVQNGKKLNLEKKFHYFNNEFTLKKEKLITNINETKTILIEDLAKVLERDNKLDEIASKTEKLVQIQPSIKQNLINKNIQEIEDLKEKKKKKKRKKIVSLVILIVVLFILALIGIFLWKELT